MRQLRVFFLLFLCRQCMPRTNPKPFNRLFAIYLLEQWAAVPRLGRAGHCTNAICTHLSQQHHARVCQDGAWKRHCFQLSDVRTKRFAQPITAPSLSSCPGVSLPKRSPAQRSERGKQGARICWRKIKLLKCL